MLPQDQLFIEEKLGLGPLFPPDTPLSKIAERLIEILSARRNTGVATE
jgi:hypothetical protein